MTATAKDVSSLPCQHLLDLQHLVIVVILGNLSLADRPGLVSRVVVATLTLTPRHRNQIQSEYCSSETKPASCSWSQKAS